MTTAAARTQPSAVLTKHQQRVLDAIKGYIEQHGFPPSHADICKAAGLKHTNSVNVCLRRLVSKGAIEMTPNIARGIKVIG